ncbi:TPA: ABC transporter ATP-binding protein [Streptococcus suis]|uniref:ABC transporter ATP-binding protein n=1 Tax=Streptococcus parasuis TaxID=1501662 RepID=UPI001C1FC25D|nr:ABC transporter ATP-binding protein [Streptococcus parasuis]MDG4498450.1 ABC transporter ATP-binding protein/permease [Streptococcus suis]QWV87126.1 ABC transporter ATP-binding protein/permease [Streptococcus parasuis]WDN59094.1 ABC transporter ATP-binding protein/permease [Streptococcus parasuis]WDN60947.1 ABC transporter ATP-binding protein/permease [Streptococcus parasuis]HEM3609199.1 ABC transporter ATP-binding protein [Streptococcus suis]
MMNKKAPQNVFWRLLSYVKPYLFLTIAALSFLLLTTVIRSIIPLLASYFIDHYVHQVTDGVLLVLGGYFGLYILQMLFQYIGNFWFAKVSYSIVRDIRQDAFSKMESLGMAYFDQTPSGSIVSRLTNDTESISEMFSGILSSFISAIFVVAVTLYTMFALEWKLTSLIVLFLPIIFILVNMYRKKAAPVVEKTRSLLSQINSKLAESIEGIRIIQAFRQEERLSDEFEAINQEHLAFASRSMALDSLFLRPALSLIKILAYAFLMTYFGLDWSDAPVSAGLIYAFIQYANRLFDPLLEVTQHFSTLQTSMVSAGRVFTLMDQTIEEPRQESTDVRIIKGDIVFEDVSFSYDGKRKILDHVSFEVKKGQTIAFVGATGSGKSSIINVFMRFYEFQSGRILIDGQDIRQFAPHELRSNIGLVLQEPFLYHGTIASNIQMYQDISQDDIIEAARFVDAAPFIEKLPNGYQQLVTERGSSFSTGQRQLLAFARTMASQPKILILDEATANIDSETEQTVQHSLEKMRKGRTTIAIAHRLSTIQDADCIYVLDKGKIIESGSHEELLALKGTYHRMYELQAGQLAR